MARHPADPTASTEKKLMATSGNECAFPGCTEPVVDPEHNTLLGKIAHIKGKKPGARRYDKSQTDEQCRAFENLVVLCGKHHDIVDDKNNEATYTVEYLVRAKADQMERVGREQDRGWIRSPNQTIWVSHGEQVAAQWWVDKSGRGQIYTEEQLEVIGALFRMQVDLSQYSTLIETLETLQGDEVRTLLQQSYAKVDRGEYPPVAHIYRLMARVPNVTFGEFLGYVIKGGDASSLIAAVREERKKSEGPSQS